MSPGLENPHRDGVFPALQRLLCFSVCHCLQSCHWAPLEGPGSVLFAPSLLVLTHFDKIPFPGAFPSPGRTVPGLLSRYRSHRRGVTCRATPADLFRETDRLPDDNETPHRPAGMRKAKGADAETRLPRNQPCHGATTSPGGRDCRYPPQAKPPPPPAPALPRPAPPRLRSAERSAPPLLLPLPGAAGLLSTWQRRAGGAGSSGRQVTARRCRPRRPGTGDRGLAGGAARRGAAEAGEGRGERRAAGEGRRGGLGLRRALEA